MSSSVVISPAPSICSWLQEDLMMPNYHYLAVERDWSDLSEKVLWCLSNPAECEEIGKNGRCWMLRHLDRERERDVLSGVLSAAKEEQAKIGLCR